MTFVKGKSGNPSGRAKTPEDILEIKKLNSNELHRIMHKYLSMTTPQIHALIQSQTLPAREAYVATVIYKGVAHGDYKRFDFILNRLIGKVTDHVQHHIEPTIIERLGGGETVLGVKEDEDSDRSKDDRG